MNSWQILPLRRVAHGFNNGTTATQIDFSDYIVTRIETISGSKINYDKVGYISLTDTKSNFKLNKNDIILSHINSLKIIGNHALYDGSKDLYHGMNLIRIIPNKEVNPKYISYQLTALKNNGYFGSIAKPAINQASIPTNSIKEIPMSVCEKNVQNKIVTYLDKKVGKIDEAIVKKKQLLQLLEEKLQARIDSLVTEGNMKKLKQVSKLINRGASPDYDDIGDVDFINQACIYWSGLILGATKKAILKSHPTRSKGYLQKDDLLVNSTGTGTLGRASVFEAANDRHYFADSHVTIVRPEQKKAISRYLWYVMRTRKFQDEIYASCVSGSTNQIELSRERFRDLLVPLPSLRKQKNLTNLLDGLSEIVEAAKREIEKSIGLLEEYKTSLISNAVTGKVKK